MKTCSHKGCTRKRKVGLYCSMHYQRKRKATKQMEYIAHAMVDHMWETKVKLQQGTCKPHADTDTCQHLHREHIPRNGLDLCLDCKAEVDFRVKECFCHGKPPVEAPGFTRREVFSGKNAVPITELTRDYYTREEVDEKLLQLAIQAGQRMNLHDGRIKGLIQISEERGIRLGDHIDEEREFRKALLDYLSIPNMNVTSGEWLTRDEVQKRLEELSRFL